MAVPDLFFLHQVSGFEQVYTCSCYFIDGCEYITGIDFDAPVSIDDQVSFEPE